MPKTLGHSFGRFGVGGNGGRDCHGRDVDAFPLETLKSAERQRSDTRLANINEFFAKVATDAETALLDTLARRTVADSLTELLRLDGIRTKRLTIAATTRRAKLLANGAKRT